MEQVDAVLNQAHQPQSAGIEQAEHAIAAGDGHEQQRREQHGLGTVAGFGDERKNGRHRDHGQRDLAASQPAGERCVLANVHGEQTGQEEAGGVSSQEHDHAQREQAQLGRTDGFCRWREGRKQK